MMNHARELMDSENEFLSAIGYEIWFNNGQLDPHSLNALCKNLLDLKIVNEEDLETHFKMGYEMGHHDGYFEGKQTSKAEQVDQHVGDLTQIFQVITRK